MVDRALATEIEAATRTVMRIKRRRRNRAAGPGESRAPAADRGADQRRRETDRRRAAGRADAGETPKAPRARKRAPWNRRHRSSRSRSRRARRSRSIRWRSSAWVTRAGKPSRPRCSLAASCRRTGFFSRVTTRSPRRTARCDSSSRSSSGRLAPAHQAFLRNARHQRTPAIVDPAGGETARTGCARAGEHIEQPFVDPDRAVEPHRMVDARHREPSVESRHAMRQQGGLEQLEIRQVGQQAAMEDRVVRAALDQPEPDMATQSGTAAVSPAWFDRAELEGSLELPETSSLGRQACRAACAWRVHVIRQRLGRRHLGRVDLVVAAGFSRSGRMRTCGRSADRAGSPPRGGSRSSPPSRLRSTS